MHSSKLFATGSWVLKDLLSPTKQYRISRRRKCLPLPQGIKYVLDLTPPDEGDAAVELTGQLSCSLGLRTWFLSSHRFGVSKLLVDGPEDFQHFGQRTSPNRSEVPQTCTPNAKSPHPARFASGRLFQDAIIVSDSATDVPSTASGDDQANPADLQSSPSQPNIPIPGNDQSVQDPIIIPLDYTTVRHRAGIERLLHAIEGLDPRIDSAPKMWTLFGVAKHLDCVSSVMDWIIPWLYGPCNTAFIEVLPEISSKLADGLQNYDLCRDAFVILVGEEALASVTRGARKATRTGVTEYGRKKEDLDEAMQTRVQYASTSLADRIEKMYSSLADEYVPWLMDLPEYRRIVAVEDELMPDGQANEPSLEIIKSLCYFLRQFILARIAVARSLSETKGQKIQPVKARGADLFPTRGPDEFYSDLPFSQRIFTRTFWIRLRSESFRLHHGSWASVHLGQISNVARMTYHDLEAAVLRFNNMVRERKHENGAWEAPAVETPEVNKDNSNNRTLISVESLTPATLLSGRYIPIRPKAWTTTSTNQTLMQQDSSATVIIPTGQASDSSTRLDSGAGQQKIRMTDERAPLMAPLATPPIHHDSLQDSDAGLPHDDTWTSDPDSGLGRMFPVSSRNAATDATLSPPAQPLAFNMDKFTGQVRSYIENICAKALRRNVSFETVATDTLMCLEESEFKYLPLWAGGDDDDTGGVFDPSIPNAEAGPSGPGPKLHTGVDSQSASDFSMIGGRDGASSFETSVAVEDGHSDHMDRRRVASETSDNSLWEEVMAIKGLNEGKGKGKAVATEEDEEMRDGEWDEGDEESFDFADDNDDEDMM